MIRIWKLEQLYEVLTTHQELNGKLSPEFQNFSKTAFLKDVRVAKAQGHKISRAVKASSALAVKERSCVGSMNAESDESDPPAQNA